MRVTVPFERSVRRENASGRERLLAARLLAGLVLALGLGSPAHAVVYVVLNANDSGAGSLRAAIASANGSAGPDEITFNIPGCPCIVPLTASLVVSESLTITGPGASSLTLDGGSLVQVLRAMPGATLTVSDLTVQNGKDAVAGGGIFASSSLAMTGVTVKTNSAPYGGGIYAGADATLVDCTLQGNTATTQDGGGMYGAGVLTISGGRFLSNQAPAHKGYGGGGGLIAFEQATISDTDFIGNSTGDWGGGAYLADFTPTPPTALDGVRFIGNTAQDGGGGGLFVWFDAVLHSVEAIGNFAGYRGGGVYGSYAGNYALTLSGGRLLNNSATGGGGLYADGDITVDGTEMAGNTARSGNGGGMWTPGSAVVSNVTVSGNIVLQSGNSGGIDTGTNLTLSSSMLSDNATLGGSGGGSGTGGTATVSDCEYSGNSASAYGGGLIAYGLADVSATHLSGNHSGDLGGGIFGNDVQLSGSELAGNTAQANWGGGAFAAQTALVADTIFTGNTSAYAGGGLAVQSSTAQVVGGRFESNLATTGGWGGAIYVGGPSLAIDGTEFASNTAQSRGGAVATPGALSLTGALLESNHATDIGGAIYAGADLDLDRSRCIDNEANQGGAVFQEGGGGGTIVNSLFARNRALGGLGEALALQASGTQVIRQSTLAAYPDPAAGSAIWVNGGTVELQSSIVVNHAQGIVQNAGTVTASFDLFDGNGVDTQGTVVNDNPVAGSPDFVDPASDDYHLTIGSAALDAGPVLAVAVDIDGQARPQGVGFDLGYDELSFAAPTGCPVSPVPSCHAAASDSLQIAVTSDPAKDRFTLKHVHSADALAQADFGDPVVGGNAYQLCLYDASGGTPALLASFVVPGGGTCGTKPCWKAIGATGFVFKDKAATNAGIRQIVLRGGDAGKGSVLVAGGGTGLPLPGPKPSGMTYFDVDPGVTAQLQESSTGNCWESRVNTADVKKNTEAQFKAVRK